ncbi:unnamed protein product [Trifolium pratense]|uniref:Uncharacterized protein n=1 Tax=Trifolium pratense TaxID=57577 RepID=A0ACB0LLS7_TRIPR|nr:unnamed protein product [Trifolium pratense]
MIDIEACHHILASRSWSLRCLYMFSHGMKAADVFLWKCMNCGLGFLSCLNITLLLMRVISILVIVLLVLWSNAHTFLHRDL